MHSESDRQEEAPLFGPGEDYKFNARLNFLHDDRFLYANGYKRAAEVLLGRLHEDRARDIDFLVYPLIFVMRHALELQLKAAYAWGHMLRDGHPISPPLGHPLSKLWAVVQGFAEARWPDGDSEKLDVVTKVLDDLDCHDRRSQAFRYPVDTRGTRTKPELGLVNVDQFMSIALTAYTLLDGISTAFENACEERSDNQG